MPDHWILLGMLLYWTVIYMILIRQKSWVVRVLTVVTAATFLIAAPIVYFELTYEPEPIQALPGIVGMSYQLRLSDRQPSKEHFRWYSTNRAVLTVDSTGIMTFVGEGIAQACAENAVTSVSSISSIEVWYTNGSPTKWWEVGAARVETSASASSRAYTCTTFVVGLQGPPPRTARRGTGTNSFGGRFFVIEP